MLINTGADANDPERLTMRQDDFSMTPPEEMEKIFDTVPKDTIAFDPIPADTANAQQIYHTETFESDGIEGWGYRVMLNGELYINQPHIPAIQGKKGFSNPVFAKMTGDFVIQKILEGFSPPTLTVEELDSLGVLK